MVLKRATWLIFALAAGCSSAPAFERSSDGSAQVASHRVLIDVSRDAQLFQLNPVAGRIEPLGRASEFATTGMTPTRVSLEYFGGNDEWLWVLAREEPFFVRKTDRLSQPYFQDTDHPYRASHSPEEFAELGLPLWNAYMFADCPKLRLGSQGRLEPTGDFVHVSDDGLEAQALLEPYAMTHDLEFSSIHCVDEPFLLVEPYEVIDIAARTPEEDFIVSFVNTAGGTPFMAPLSDSEEDILRALAADIYAAFESERLWFLPYAPFEFLPQMRGLPKNTVRDEAVSVLAKYARPDPSWRGIPGAYLADPQAEDCIAGSPITAEEEAAFRSRVAGLDLESLLSPDVQAGKLLAVTEEDIIQAGNMTDPKQASYAVIAYLTAIQQREFAVALLRPDFPGEPPFWGIFVGEATRVDVNPNTSNEFDDYVGHAHYAHSHPYRLCEDSDVDQVGQPVRCVCLGASAGIEMQGGEATIVVGDVMSARSRDRLNTVIVSPVLHGPWDGNYIVMNHRYPSDYREKLPIRTHYGIIHARVSDRHLR